MEQQKIIALISKALSLAEGTTNEAEKALAYEKVNELLTKYKLELADIEAHDAKARETIEVHQFRICKYASEVKEWKRIIGFAVARYCYCKGYSVGGTDMMFVGRKTDIVVARQVFDSIINQMLQMLEIAALDALNRGEMGQWHGVQIHPRAWRQNYLLAAAYALARRLDTMKSRASLDQAVNALVISSEGEIQRYQDEKMGKVGVHENQPVTVVSAAAHGVEDSKNIHLSLDVRGTNNTPKQLKG